MIDSGIYNNQTNGYEANYVLEMFCMIVLKRCMELGFLSKSMWYTNSIFDHLTMFIMINTISVIFDVLLKAA